MLKKFPFGDSIVKDLDMINPDKVCTYYFDKVKSGAALSFRQLNILKLLDLVYLI